jgi:PhnB protein
MVANAIRPKLVLADAALAIDFYVRALDADVLACFRVGDSIVFAELRILGCSVTLKDADETDPAPTTRINGPILDVVLDDPDSVAARMVDAGAEMVFPIADQPYGARGERVLDPHGVQWLLQTPVQMTPEQWQAVVESLKDDA